ncbi:MAG TPA: HAD hydrolase family protein [candidate division Zixibacteria bacterium]|nr:HAD hydrolase family protein [candidate division Zixibacteria bacterium]MDD4917437.1 HAD hydrolase family protein [candidate division Zixibacteria bacterium]MDM7972995.1 HAD hydrolase family protein [candidate division Zixibacteria bacterium]HOD67285.1 HAD hydrolase family protein [candidate division Zixibacteria bacterium]HPI33346.1 HAD hydrolase family protein [candidate division Zixibacteria bacterium]
MPKPKLTRTQLVGRFKNVKLLAMDVDGVLTDDTLYFGPDGFEMKRFHISDGLMMVLAMRAGLQLAVVSGRYSAATETRMRDLGIPHVLQGMKDKVAQITPLLAALQLSFADIAFVGNEILDITLAERAGLALAVADASPHLVEVVDYVTAARGGAGAVREILEAYFEAIGQEPRRYLV